MDKDVRDKWVAALRSGTYKQGIEGLARVENDEARFCCLGVLCDIYDREIGNNGWTDRGDGRMAHTDRRGISRIDYLPPDVYKWAGLREPNPVVNTDLAQEYAHYNQESRPLASLNDSGISFEAIANLIEEQY